MRISAESVCALAFFLLSCCWAVEPPTAMRCELLLYPERTWITDPRPEFSWQNASLGKGVQQTGFQILVASTTLLAEREIGDLWDSGLVSSEQSQNIEYAGTALTAEADYFWRVRVWCGSQGRSRYSRWQKFHFTSAVDDYSTDNRLWLNRYPLQITAAKPVRFQAKSPSGYFCDFGQAAFGTVEVNAPAQPTTSWRVHLGEVLAGPDSLAAHPGGSRRFRSWSMTVPASRLWSRAAVPPDHRNTHGDAVRMPLTIGEVMPFRYCKLESVTTTLSSQQIRQLRVHYPFDDDAAAFHSSDQILNDVWDLCKYSIKATTFLGVYVDGDRERIPYEGDAYINQLGHYSVDAEYSLARHTLEYLFRHPTWPAEWQMHMVMMAWQDYLYTGNRELLAHHYQDLAAKTLTGLSREDGLIVEDSSKMTPSFLRSLNLSSPPRILVDWPPASFTDQHRYGERDGYDMRPVNTVANAFHYHVLGLMARISEALDRPEESLGWQNRQARVYQAFQRSFYRAEQGVYTDGEDSDHASLHANFYPLAFGLVPAECVSRVVEFIKSRGMACSVYGSQHLLDALYSAGEQKYALTLLTATHDRSWAHMIYDVHSTITTEAWDNKYKENQDWNHAWGAAPANIIPRGLMGLQPLLPGCRKIRIRPQISDLDFAEIKFPTLYGAVRMRMEQAASGCSLRLTLPPGMTGELHVPAKDLAAVREQGRPVAQNPSVVYERTEAGRLVFNLQPGRYFFQYE